MEKTQLEEILKKSENKIQTLKQLMKNSEEISYADKLNVLCKTCSDSEKIELIKNKELLKELKLDILERDSLFYLMESLSSDKEKLKLLTNIEFLKERNLTKRKEFASTSISGVIQSLSSDEAKINIMKDKNLLKELELEALDIKEITQSLSSDEEKINILKDLKFLKELEVKSSNITGIIEELSEDESKLEIIKNPKLLKELEVNADDISNIIQSLSKDESKLEIIKDQKLLDELDLETNSYMSNISKITQSLSKDELKLEIIKDQKLLENLDLSKGDISDIIKSLSKDESKLEIIKDQKLLNELDLDSDIKSYTSEITNIIQSLSADESKLEILKKENFIKDNNLSTNSITNIINTFSANDKKIEAVVDNKELIKQLKTKNELPVENMKKITKAILENIEPEEEKIEILSNKEEIEELKIDEKDFIEIVKKLSSEEAKASILKKYDLTLEEAQESEKDNNNSTNQKLQEKLERQKKKETIEVDLNSDLEQYRGKDDKIVIYPETLEEDEKEKLNQLCKICPNLEIRGTLLEAPCTVEEYIEGEKWIGEVLSKIKPEHTDAQKIAIIDHEIGKKISYSPDFETEIFDGMDSRNMWRIISTGYGVCNGIANLERYMLEREGIETELISSPTHAFLKIKDIEIPCADGTTQRGTTINDPTWNLAAQRFDAAPKCFLTSYEDIRKRDIEKNGNDRKSHRNNTRLQDATMKIEPQALLDLYESVGLIQDKQFKVGKTEDISQKIHEIYANNPKQEIEEQFKLLKKVCPEFATCQNSSMAILSQNLLKEVEAERCVVNRVYDKKDQKKEPQIYVYTELDETEKLFYYADKEKGEFIELPEEEFKEKFDCYQEDLIEGKKPWEIKEQETKEVDLRQSSGTIEQNNINKEEGDER